MRIGFSLFGLILLLAPAHADEVRLQITGPDKKPVAGAQVRVIESSGIWEARKTEVPLDLTSDEKGKVTFQSKNPLTTATQRDPSATPNSVFARISAPGLALLPMPLKAGDNEITLQAGQSWGGTAFDEDQKLVAGVKIVLNTIQYPEADKPTYFPKMLKLESTTTENGKWRFEGLPLRGKTQILLADPRFVRETFELSLNGSTAPPLFLERGATIKGRLLTPEGQGAANVLIYPGGRAGYRGDTDDFLTGSDGRFVLSGLAPGDYYLHHLNLGRTEKLPFIVEPKSVKGVQVGDVRDIGDWKTESGILVKGRVVASSTQKPLEAHISLWGSASAQGRSDKEGSFSFQANEEASMGSISASGHIGWQKQLPAVVNGVLDMGTIELKPGFEARGVIKDKKGRGVGALQVIAEKGGSNSAYGRTGDSGDFIFDALEAGQYTLKVQGAKLVETVKFSVAADQKTAAIEAVLDTNIQVDAPNIIRGRALDNAGNPVAGAKILLRITDPSRSYNTLTTVSNTDGNFETKFSLTNGIPKVSEATRPGLFLVRANEFKVVDNVWQTDLIFQPRGIALRGQVVDKEGKPVKGAFVSVAGRNNLPIVATDESGAFALIDAPLEDVTLIASDGRSYGESTIEKAGENIHVTLQPGAEYDAMALADELLPNSKLGHLWGERWTTAWNALGTARMEAAVLRAKTNGPGWEWTWNQYLNRLARHDPKSFLVRADELMALAPKDNTEGLALLAQLRASSDHPAEREKARTWLVAQGKPSLSLTAGTVTTLLRTARVAEALEAGDGAKWVDFAAQIAAQLPDKARAGEANEWGQLAAATSPQAFENFIQEWTGNAQLNAYHGAVTRFSQEGEIAAARDMLKRMEEALPAAQTAKDEVRVEGFVQKPKDIVAQARGAFASALHKTDPTAALKLAPEVADYERSLLLIEIGKSAAKLGQKQVAAQALRQVFESRYSNVEPGAAAAEVALSFAPKLADELFALAWEKAKPRSAGDEHGYDASLAAYAGARAKNWPGESRLLIEREWAWRIKAYKPPEDRDYDSKAENLKSLVGAMSRIDARRALEMAEQLPEKGNMRAEARGQIAITLLQNSKGQTL